jgi:titin
VTVTWTDSFTGLGAPVDSYDVVRGSGGSFATIGTGIGTGLESFTDNGVTNGTTYSYYMVAYAGTSPSDNSVTVTVIPAGPPGIPAGVTVSEADASATLAWTHNVPVHNVPVSVYGVYRTLLPAGSPVSVGSAPATFPGFVDSGLSNGSTYVYEIEAVNMNGTTSLSRSVPVNAFPFVMGPPSSVSNSSDDTSVDLTWSAPTTPASSFPVSTYTVTRIDPQGVSQVFTGQASPFSDTTAAPGVLYSWHVQAVDDSGHTGPASAAILDGRASAPPPAPSSLVVLPGNGQNLVDWAPVTVTAPGSLPVSHYILTTTSGAGPITLEAHETFYLDEGLTNGVQYDYTVVSVDAAGHFGSPFHVSGTPSVASGTPLLANLNPPTNLVATALDSTSIFLTWDPPNESRDLENYVITRSNSFNGSYGNPVTLSLDVFPPPLSAAVTGLIPGRTYYFQMRVYERTTGVASSFSNHAWATTPSGGGAGQADPGGDLYLDRNVLRLFQGEALVIYYLLPATADVKITIHTVAGRPIRTLEPGPISGGVETSTVWDGLDRNGNRVASGIYLIHLQAGGFRMVKKVIVVK